MRRQGRTSEYRRRVGGKWGTPNTGRITEGLQSQGAFGSDGTIQQLANAGLRSTK